MIRSILIAIRVFSLIAYFISVQIATAQNPIPLLNQPLVPDAIAPAPPGSTLALTVNGTGFVPQSSVNWNGSPRPTFFVSSSRLIAYILSSDIALLTTAWITVVNPAPGGGTSNLLFLPVHNPTPTLSFRRTDYPVGGNPQFPAGGDFNRDGKLDLAVANYGTGSVSILLAIGDGTFQGATSYPAGPNAQVPIVGDLNGDSFLDIAVPYWPCSIAVLLGNGNGTFKAAVSYATGCTATHGITADFNGDGKLDLAVANWGSGVSVLLGNGDGTFQTTVDYQIGSEPTGIAAGDFNRDGKLDLATSNWGSNNVSILLGNGDGTFQRHVEYVAGNNPGNFAVADVNGDGKLDIVVPNQYAPTISVLLGNGDGTFGPPAQYPAVVGNVTIGDLNQDRKLDLACGTANTVDILPGNGDGSFQTAMSFPTGNRPWTPFVADFNGDGRLDVVTGNFDDGTVSILLSTATTVSKRQYRAGR